MPDLSLDAWDSLLEIVNDFQTALGRSRAVLVSTTSLRGAAKSIVQQYFRQTRPYLTGIQFSADDLNDLDAEMQSLLRLSNGSNRKQSYAGLLKRARRHLHSIEAAREVRLGEASNTVDTIHQLTLSAVETRILETLNRLIPSAAASYEQAILDLNSSDRLSFRGTANELRETLREVLDHLAPDSEVTQASGFKLEAGQNKPTQKQKVRHILRARRLPRTAIKVPEDAVSLAEELTASVARSTYERSSISTHITTAKQEVQRMKMYIESVLADLLEIHT